MLPLSSGRAGPCRARPSAGGACPHPPLASQRLWAPGGGRSVNAAPSAASGRRPAASGSAAAAARGEATQCALLRAAAAAASAPDRRRCRRRGGVVAAAAPSGPPDQQQQGADSGREAGGGSPGRERGRGSGHTTNSVATPAGTLQVGTFLSNAPDAAAAVAEAVSVIRDGLGGESFQPELALVFATAAYGPGLEEIVPALRAAVPSLRHVFGCTSFGVVGVAATGDGVAPGDMEGVPGLSVTLARLPGCEIAVTHTLRSGIPDEDASPETWSDLVGLSPGSELPTSFLVLADPKFQQTRPLLAGLDFAFPAATKVGGVISSGQRYKRRAMYAWSADAPVQAGSRQRRETVQQRRTQQQQQQRQQEQEGGSGGSASGSGSSGAPAAAQEAQPQAAQPPQQQPPAGEPKDRGFFGSLMSKIRSSFGDEGSSSTSSAGASSSSSASSSALQQQQAQRWRGSSSGGGGDEEGDEWGNETGLHMYGAAVLSLRGNVYFDPITSQGYRVVSDRSWVVGRVSRDGNVIYSLIDPNAPADDEDDGEVPPLLALVDMMEAASLGGGSDNELTEGELEDLSDDKVWVAIAPDALSADKDIAPDDFQMMKLTDFDEQFGAICVDGQVRTGYRLKLVLRDSEGIRADLAAKLLRLKREDLAAVLSGDARPPAIASLLFVDLERGLRQHGEEGYEAGQVGAFLPVPLAGMYAAAEVSTVNRKAALYELATVAAVLRVAPQPDGGGGGSDSTSSKE